MVIESLRSKLGQCTSKVTCFASSGPLLELEGACEAAGGVAALRWASLLGTLRSGSGAGGEAGRRPPPRT
eukprot:6742459-Alexandrium_andersonii.AAC.1